MTRTTAEEDAPGTHADAMHRARVLVLDDEDGIRNLTSQALAADQFEVSTARNGAEALALLETARYDVVLTDMRMSGLSGADLVRALRAADPDAEVVVMTGHATIETAVAAVRAGAYEYVEKPFRIRDMVTIVGRAVENGHLRGMVGLHEASRRMLRTTRGHDLIPRILQLVGTAARGDVVRLAVPRVGGEGFEVHRGSPGEEGPPDARVATLTRDALEGGSPLCLPSNLDGPSHPLEEWGRAVVYPLVVSDRRIGSLSLWRRSRGLPFSTTEVRRGALLAVEAAMAIDSDALDRELHRRVRELTDARTRLVAAERLASTGRLAAGIAHEINTPTQFVGDSVRFLRDALSAVGPLLDSYRKLHEAAVDAGFAPELVRDASRAEEDADPAYLLDEVPKAIDRAIEGVGRIADIVRAMKEFAHPGRKEKSAADLNRALESTLTVARNEIKYVADVETDLGSIPTVMCHLGDLNQVFLNLLVNAAHAIRDVVGESGARGTITVATRHESDHVVVSITDTGCGIPEGVRDRVFEPFFTTKEVGTGTGQGLAIARSIVEERHGGTIDFVTRVGTGTTFRVRLPLKPAPSPHAEVNA